tara:strand:- start:3047 stop:3670 length:624 start_codon:yes stop_codon:yes gene_type:complete
MHQLNVLFFGPNTFFNTLIELKSYLKFNLEKGDINHELNSLKKFDILFIHDEILTDKKYKNIISIADTLKVLATNKIKSDNKFTGYVKLPTTLNEINSVIENSIAKKIFNKNSSIKIKDYILDKNAKKLSKNKTFIILTEKEVQLLELFLKNSKSISKNDILTQVWHYSSDADTHTVETHIYRLRKKINDKFSDNDFILNNKNGYFL